MKNNNSCDNRRYRTKTNNGDCNFFDAFAIENVDKSVHDFSIDSVYDLASIVVLAMQKSKSISAYFRKKFRKMTPYFLGFKDNKLCCLFYQYGDEGRTGDIENETGNWSCSFIKDLQEIQILDEPFYKVREIPATLKECIDYLIFEVIPHKDGFLKTRATRVWRDNKLIEYDFDGTFKCNTQNHNSLIMNKDILFLESAYHSDNEFLFKSFYNFIIKNKEDVIFNLNRSSQYVFYHYLMDIVENFFRLNYNFSINDFISSFLKNYVLVVFYLLNVCFSHINLISELTSIDENKITILNKIFY